MRYVPSPTNLVVLSGQHQTSCGSSGSILHYNTNLPTSPSLYNLLAAIMSIALDSTTRIAIVPSSGFAHRFGMLFESPDDRRVPVGEEAVSSSSSSSIGNNSDVPGRPSSDEGEDCGDEAQSSYKGSLEMMNALEEVLPMRRGISKFYNYKSKSFTSLAEASSSSSSIKDIAKPDNAYSRKRRNLLASNLIWDKNRNSLLRSNGGCISKTRTRPISSSRSTFALAVDDLSTSTSPESSTSSASEESNSRSPPRALPPRHPLVNHIACRSWSMADLQDSATSSGTSNTSRFFPTKSNMFKLT